MVYTFGSRHRRRHGHAGRDTARSAPAHARTRGVPTRLELWRASLNGIGNVACLLAYLVAIAENLESL
jgi:hypothetical protein